MIDKKMTVVEHLEELRRRIIISLAAVAIGACVAFWKIKLIVKFLMLPPVDHLVFFSPTEAFMEYFKLAFFIGLVLASPVVLYQLWAFVSAGLKDAERRIVLVFLPFSIILFLGAAAFAFFIVIPWALKFLVNFAGPGVWAMISISKYLSFVTTFLLIFGLVFEMPVAIVILSKLGLVTPAFLSKNRKWAILIIFIAAAVVTPTPDAFTQCLMAAPLIVLYEISIWVSKLVNIKRKER